MHRNSMWRVGALGGSIVAAYGTLFYAFSVLITTEAAGGEFSTGLLSVAYGGMLLIAGLMAFPVGRRADRRGVRTLLASGAVVGSAGLVLLGFAHAPWQLLAVAWGLLAPAAALTFYETSFIAVNQWVGVGQRPKALGFLVVVGGFSGPIFLPLTAMLVDRIGWRPTTSVLAAILLAVTGGVAILAVPGERERSEVEAPRAGVLVLRDRRFVLFTLALILVNGGTQAIFLHRLAVFEASGLSLTVVAAWAAASGWVSFGGRIAGAPLGSRWGPARVFIGATVLLAASAALLVSPDGVGRLALQSCLFGFVAGPLSLLRALVMTSWYSGGAFGSTMGMQWAVVAVCGSVIPAGVGVLRDATGGYDLPMLLLTGLFALAAVLAGAAATADTGSRKNPVANPGPVAESPDQGKEVVQ